MEKAIGCADTKATLRELSEEIKACGGLSKVVQEAERVIEAARKVPFV